MSSSQQASAPAWRREAPRDDSPDGRSEISLEGTPIPAWKKKPRAWINRTNVLTALIVFILSVFFLVVTLRPGRRAVKKDPNVTTLKAQFFPEHKSQRVMIRYGPFTAPPMSEHNGMKNFEQGVARMPCADCLVTWVQAGLTYEDGTEANADTGMWLHHTVFSNTNRSSVVCSNYRGDRFFASGNERTPLDICESGTEKAGYYIPQNENVAFSVELMNMIDEPRDTYMTMTYEYIEGMPSGFSNVKSLWLDIGGCESSELPAKPNAHFDYSSPPWIVPIGVGGKVTFTAGHLHDGGTRLEIMRNGELACESLAKYGCEKMEGELEKRHGHDMPGMNMTGMHISSMSSCKDVGQVKPGDEWTITAHYNTVLHEPMVNSDGNLEPIMGIALVYVAEE